MKNNASFLIGEFVFLFFISLIILYLVGEQKEISWDSFVLGLTWQRILSAMAGAIAGVIVIAFVQRIFRQRQ